MTVQDFGFIMCKNNLIIEFCVRLNVATKCLVLLPLRVKPISLYSHLTLQLGVHRQ